jgi:hypothetical protein
MMNTAEALERFAAEIGEQVYIDVAKWHLYLKDAHLHTVVAEKLYPLLVDGSINEQAVNDTLQGILVKIGGGKQELPLTDLIPKTCQMNLLDVVDRMKREL